MSNKNVLDILDPKMNVIGKEQKIAQRIHYLTFKYDSIDSEISRTDK